MNSKAIDILTHRTLSYAQGVITRPRILLRLEYLLSVACAIDKLYVNQRLERNGSTRLRVINCHASRSSSAFRECSTHVWLSCLVSLRTKAGGGRAAFSKEATKHRLDQGAEDNLSTTSVWVSPREASVVHVHTYPVWGSAIQSTRTNLKV